MADGWEVIGTTRSPEKVPLLLELGVEPVVVDVYDEERLKSVMAEAQPVAVIHQLTDLPPGLDPSQMPEALARNARLRELLFDFFLKNALAADSFARALTLLRERLPEGSQWGMLTLLGSHDTPRVLTECGGDHRVVQLLFTFLLTYPGAPMLYYGDENGMEGGGDPDCRRSMVWEPERWKGDIRATVHRLLALRRAHPVLRRGTFEVAYAEDRVFSFYRVLGNERVLVVLNNTRVPRELALTVSFSEGTWLTEALSHQAFTVENGCVRLAPLEPRQAWVLLESGRLGSDATSTPGR